MFRARIGGALPLLNLLSLAALIVASAIPLSGQADTIPSQRLAFTIDENPSAEFVAEALEELETAFTWPTPTGYDPVICACNYGGANEPEPFDEEFPFIRLTDDIDESNFDPNYSLILDWRMPPLFGEFSPLISNIWIVSPNDSEQLQVAARELWAEYFELDDVWASVPIAFVIKNGGISQLGPLVWELLAENWLIDLSGQPVGPGVYPIFVGPFTGNRHLTIPPEVWAVHVSAIPEPASHLLLVLGSVLVGTLARRSARRAR